MALDLTTRYPTKIDAGQPGYTYGKARNVVVSEDGTGTPWEKDLINDTIGFHQALLVDAGVIPSGAPDSTLSSDYLTALRILFSKKEFPTAIDMQLANLQSGEVVETNGRYTIADGGGWKYIIKTSAEFGGTPDGYGDLLLTNGNVAVILPDAKYNALRYGVIGDGDTGVGTDNVPALQALINRVGLAGGGEIELPTPSKESYVITSTIYFNYNRVKISGNGTTIIRYRNIAGGTAISSAVSYSTVLAECQLTGVTVLGEASDGPDVVLDMSSFTYSTFDRFSFQTKRSGGINILGEGHTGASPYYNVINDFLIGGNAARDVRGIVFRAGSFAGSNGPNANIITNCKRGYSLDKLIQITKGLGNIFSNIQAETIKTAYVELGLTSASLSGVATSAAVNSITDSGATFGTSGEFNNGTIQITGGTGAGQYKRIASHNNTQINVDSFWTIVPDNTSTYLIFTAAVAENSFVNFRGEGDAIDLPNFFKVLPGSFNNTATNIKVGSIGDYISDPHKDPTNTLIPGSLINFTFYKSGVAASQTGLSLDPPAGAVFYRGGQTAPSKFIIESMTVNCPGVTAGSATIKVNLAATAELTAYLNTTISDEAVAFKRDYKEFDGLQRPISVTIDTDAAWAAGTADINVNVLCRLIT